MAPKTSRSRQQVAVPKTTQVAVAKAPQAADPSSSGSASSGDTSGLRGATVVFTGELDGMTRDEALDKVKAAGGKVMSALSGKTAFFVVGTHLDDGRPVEETSKYRKYLELRDKGKGCPRLLYEADLLTMLQAAGAVPAKGAKLNDIAKPAQIAAATSGPISTPWVDRHAPKGFDDLLGNASAVKKLVEWLRDWDDVVLRGRTKAPRFKAGGGMPDNVNARAALVSGPPGIGKSTACRLVAALHGAYEVQEYNASDARSQKMIQAMADGIASNRTLSFGSSSASAASSHPASSGTTSSVSALGGTVAPGAFSTKRVVIIMDEVDGMGAGDRGGNAALIKMIKKTKNPIICICNDHSSPKVRSLAFSCYEIRFQRPSKSTIAQRAAQIAAAEGLQVEENALEALAESCGNDVRHVLNQLQIMSDVPSFKDMGVAYEDMRDRLRSIAKDEAIMMTPFEATKRLLTSSSAAKMGINQLLDLFFVDFNLVHLMVQENYLNSVAKKPVEASFLDSCARSAEMIATGDMLSRSIRDEQMWGLLPSMGLISTVYPAYLTNGFVAFPEFPKFLGNYSKQSRARRLAIELHAHLRISTTLSRRNFVRSGHLQQLHDKSIRSLRREDVNGAVDVLDAYGLQRIHLAEHLPELMQHLRGEDEFKLVDPKVKASMTREMNSGSHAVRVVLPASKKRKAINQPEGDDLDEDGPAEQDKPPKDDQPPVEDNDSDGDDLGGLLKPSKPKRGAKVKAEPPPKNQRHAHSVKCPSPVVENAITLSAGCTVRLCGLQTVALNGQGGVAQTFVEATGRWRVMLLDGGQKDVLPKNLQLEVAFRPGCTVRLCGLQTTSLNGQVGVAQAFIEATCRWRVDLSNGVHKDVLPKNLNLEEPQAASMSTPSSPATAVDPPKVKPGVKAKASIDDIDETKSQAASTSTSCTNGKTPPRDPVSAKAKPNAKAGEVKAKAKTNHAAKAPPAKSKTSQPPSKKARH